MITQDLVFKHEKNRLKNENKRVELIDNFNLLSPNGVELIPRNFNKISKLSTSSYQKIFKKSWLEVLDMFNKKEELFNLLLEEFDNWNKKTGKQALNTFCIYIGYTYSTLKEEERQVFREVFNISNRKLFTLQELEENFHGLTSKLGKIPLYSEFMNQTDIDITVYTRKLNLRGIGSVYDEIVKLYVTEEEFHQYKEQQQEHKKKVGKSNHQGIKYTDEELEYEFKLAFDKIYENTGEYPPRRVFNKISKFDDSLYRKRLNMSFTEVIEYYGYEVTDRIWKSEKMVLKLISGILQENYSPQHTFDWLLSIKDFPLFCDGYFEKLSLVVEYDGRQHLEPVTYFGGEECFARTQANDKIKNTLIPQHNLKLLRIAYDEPYLDEDYLKFKLLSIGIDIPKSTVISNK